MGIFAVFQTSEGECLAMGESEACKVCDGSGILSEISTDRSTADFNLAKTYNLVKTTCQQCNGTGRVGIPTPFDTGELSWRRYEI